MLRVRILVGTANNTPTWSDAQASTSYCSVCQEEGVDGGGGGPRVVALSTAACHSQSRIHARTSMPAVVPGSSTACVI